MQALSGATGNNSAGPIKKASTGALAQPPSATTSLDREETKKKEADIENAVSSTVVVSDQLEQDKMEGVDEKEWVRLPNPTIQYQNVNVFALFAQDESE